MLTTKATYPWKIGATSFVIPSDLSSNVSLLAGRVDAVQLLFFESSYNSTQEHVVDLDRLRDLAEGSGLTYTVHLPSDIQLSHGAEAARQRGLDEICRLVEKLSPLSPFCYDLHLTHSPAHDINYWLDGLDSSLAELSVRLGRLRERVAIENIDYPYAMIQPIVEDHGFARCLDLGHIRRYGHNLEQAFDEVCSARHVHFHGLRNGRDHEAISQEDVEYAVRLGERLWQTEFAGVVTMEVYSLEKLENSLRTLEKVWQKYERSYT